jgi:hypothetical protein
MRNREEFLKLASLKQSTFKVPSLDNYEILMRELTIAESDKFNQVRDEDGINKAIIHACRCSCIEPEFFTNEELETLGRSGQNAIMEIFSEIPLVGKSKKQREEYLKNLKEISKADSKEKEEVSEEDQEKK